MHRCILRRSIACLIFGIFFTASLPAQACQLVCVLTTEVYNGNLGGQAGADAKCHAEYPGFKFARSGSILRNISGAAVTGTAPLAWVGSSVAKNNPAYDCAAWSSNSNLHSGARVDISTNTLSEGPPVMCSGSLPLLCCNI